jgi:hypothetical protein
LIAFPDPGEDVGIRDDPSFHDRSSRCCGSVYDGLADTTAAFQQKLWEEQHSHATAHVRLFNWEQDSDLL